MDREAVLACMAFPAQHCAKLHSANAIERLNGEGRSVLMPAATSLLPPLSAGGSMTRSCHLIALQTVQV